LLRLASEGEKEVGSFARLGGGPEKVSRIAPHSLQPGLDWKLLFRFVAGLGVRDVFLKSDWAGISGECEVGQDSLFQLLDRFFRSIDTDSCNEAELQHEIGYWLRTNLPFGWHVYFERPADSFFPQATRLVKKEIDLVIVSPAPRRHFALELKCSRLRQGRFPETMFDVCRDLQFLEQLVSHGFCGGLFAILADSPLFYDTGKQDGIYSYFKGGQPLHGEIRKPTGEKDQVVNLHGSYCVQWNPCGTGKTDKRYWLQSVRIPGNAIS